MTAAGAGSLGTIRVLSIPDHRPPPRDPGSVWPDARHVQETLALELADRVPATATPIDLDAELPDPLVWGFRVAQALIEVMAGLRPPAQVVRRTTPEVFVGVSRMFAGSRRRAASAATAGRATPRRVRVHRVHLCRPAGGIAELAVTLIDGPRVRAMALRLEAVGADWRVTALAVG